jgi:hypothetical protein
VRRNVGPRRAAAWTLALISAVLWSSAGWEIATFEGVTGPAIILGLLFIVAVSTSAASAALFVVEHRSRGPGE